MNELVYFDDITQSLSKAVARGEASLDAVPGLLRMIIRRKMWRKRISSITGGIVEFESFEQFVNALPPEGLGTTIEAIKCLCCNEPKMLATIEKAIGKNPSQHASGQESNSFRPRRRRSERVFDISNIPTLAYRLRLYLTPEQLSELISNLRTE